MKITNLTLTHYNQKAHSFDCNNCKYKITSPDVCTKCSTLLFRQFYCNGSRTHFCEGCATNIKGVKLK